MLVRRGVVVFGLWLLPGLGPVAVAQAGGGKGACGRAVVEGEVEAGKGFEHRLGNGLEVMLEPIQSGWALRVLAVGVARGPHDYAELATPPYGSVSPLLIGTDFSFRAQDAVGWNPRRFHYAADGGSFARMLGAFQEYRRTNPPSAKAEAELAALTAKAPEGVLEILDARLVPGTADQAQAAAMVASHFATTAHRVEQPAEGKSSALGRVTWMRFRVGFEVGAGFRPEAGVAIERRACPSSK